MKAFFVFVVIMAFFASLYFGFIYLVGKSMKSAPTVNVDDTTTEWQKKSQEAADLQQRQRDLMQQRQDRMRDLQRR